MTDISIDTNARDLSVPMIDANRKSLVFAFPPVILVWAFYLFHWGWPRAQLGKGWVLSLVGFCLAGIIAHEAIHGLTWALFGTKSFSTIRFGMNLKALAPYAHATVPMKAGRYRLGTIAPTFVLGVLPSLYGLITGNLFATIFASVFLAAGAGDFLVLWLIRAVPSDALIRDHPTNAGCIVLGSDPVDRQSPEA